MKSMYSVMLGISLLSCAVSFGKGPWFEGKFTAVDPLNPEEPIVLEFVQAVSGSSIQPGTQAFLLSCNHLHECQSTARMPAQVGNVTVDVLKNLQVSQMKYEPNNEKVWMTEFSALRAGSAPEPAFKIITSSRTSSSEGDTMLLIPAGSGRQILLTKMP